MPEKLELKLFAISAELGCQNIPLSLKLFLIFEHYFQLLKLCLCFLNVLTLINLREELLIEEVADLLWILLVFHFLKLRIRH